MYKKKDKNKKDKNLTNDFYEELSRIRILFKKYWKVLFFLVFSYIACYILWVFISYKIINIIKNFEKKKGENWTKESLIITIFLAFFQGMLFTVDGTVTSLLKTPFQQMCYNINKSSFISHEIKDKIVTKATESNEHCKETLKKFGVISIVSETIRVFIQSLPIYDAKTKGKYAWILMTSYLIPLIFAGKSILYIELELKKLEKNIKDKMIDEKNLLKK